MTQVTLANNSFNPNGYWNTPIAKLVFLPTHEDLALFDQNGYDLTDLEKHFAYSNHAKPKRHRDHIHAIKSDWFMQGHTIDGAILNHSLLFERKAYTGAALEELQVWARKLPIINKLIALRPKWGLDFSMDYVDYNGNAFELLHWEWDSFNYDEIEQIRIDVEPVLANIDWDYAATQLLARKQEWHHLGFFEQSNWKCNYFGMPRERFKMVAWS